MIKIIRDKWLEALRSGKFLQGTHQLKTEDGLEIRYCCLGVLRHVVNPNDNRGGSYLSLEQLIEYGLSQENQCALADLNDFDRKSFLSIADYIETHY